jgi:hypothetical protein
MKTSFFSLLLAFLCFYTFAQAPEGFNYQGIARDSKGKELSNTTISLRLGILQDSAAGNTVFTETHNIVTNDYGLFTVRVGAGKLISGDFSKIKWPTGLYFIKVEIDPAGGSNYTFLGSSQLLSVPFTLMANSALKSLNDLDTSATNELQTLSIRYDTIFLTNGGFVKLPAAFTTVLLPPKAIVQPASNILSFSATINGFVNGKGLSTTVVFEWGLTTSYGTVIPIQNPVTGNSDVAVSANLTGLQSATIYHYRIKAVNAVNVTYSSDSNFTTATSVAQLTTTAISSITSTNAISGGSISHDGGATITFRGVCWNTSSNPTTSFNKTTDGTGIGSFTSNITGLTLGTTYYVRAYATNSLGTIYGNELSFTTNGLPTVTTSNIKDVKGNSAKAGGNITNNGGITISAQGLCWSTIPNPTTTNSYSTSFTASMSVLSPNTVYYVRAYATNSLGTSYSNQISFNSGYLIGSNYSGGLVFYNDGNSHGLVCASTDQSTGAEWGCNGTTISGTSTAINTGAANTNAIVAGCTTAGIAAKICYDLVLNTYSDWYLPSKDELNFMYVNLQTQSIGGFASSSYWSSSELNNVAAWLQMFYNGTQSNAGKYSTPYVRAVRAF